MNMGCVHKRKELLLLSFYTTWIVPFFRKQCNVPSFPILLCALL